ncbi:hypothetical protein CI109_100745 [Kwoniella shandongensis]|uniref:Uncharacterized protein n=1 Tax=Kwoniella shandongensis TaxID=1734106 RepID=A0A5M6BMZ2_9TREE|nr:uncharacterized protein CI109_007425 [Kwoniella shandongensis]KAA5524248.1 hypothetical protein CI109_007425 [Kwoniella shandongensis]
MPSPEMEETRSSDEPIPPGRKRKPRPSRGVKNKVLALENQMQQVQNSLQNVTHLLQRVVATSAPLSAIGGGVGRPGAAQRQDLSPHSLPFPESSLQQVRSLEQWVQQISTSSSSQPLPSISNPSRQTAAADRVPATTATARSQDFSVSGEEEDDGGGDDSLTDNAGEEEDTLAEGGLLLMRDMLRKEESARLRADGHLHHPRGGERGGNANLVRGNIGRTDSYPLEGRKRRRTSSTRETVLQRGTTRGSLSDPVDLGMCDEVQGKELFDLFFQGAHSFMPVYDPSEDTWQSLRSRSPFSIAAILFVGKKIQDAGKPESELQRQLREHAENIGKTTLFSPIASIEALQAMIILASWGDTGWRPGSHAVSIAFDMELYKCLPKLAARAAAWHEARTPSEQVPSRSLVVGARLWLLVSKMAIEMAFNHGRPLGVHESDVLTHAHALLNHPSGLPTDSRIIASCELLMLRLPLHRIFICDQDNPQDLDIALQQFNEEAHGWEIRWQQYYLQRGVSQDDLLVSDLTTQRCFSSVLSNSSLLRDIRGPNDVIKLPPHRRRWLLATLDDARMIAGRILSKEKDKLLHANHYSHVALASVCRIYIRLASLFPEAVDLRRTAKDLNQLADVLAQFPGFHFAQRLRYVITKARTRRVFPPETRPPSPGLYDPHDGGRPVWGEPPTPIQNHNAPLPSITTANTTTSQSPFDFDLFAAEHLLNQIPTNVPWGYGEHDRGAGAIGVEQGSSGGGGAAWDLGFGDMNSGSHSHASMPFVPSGQTSFLSWLDFPALELDVGPQHHHSQHAQNIENLHHSGPTGSYPPFPGRLS